MGNPNPWPLAWSLTAACLVTLFGGGAYVFVAMQPERVQAPTAYAKFAANDKAFKCEYPQGWKARQGQPQGIASWADFKKGSAQIEINADLQGSLQGDILAAQQRMSENMGGESGSGGMGGGMPPIPGMDGQVPGGLGGAPTEKRPPVEVLHDTDKKALDEELEEYQELPVQKFPSNLGDARISEFTYKGEGWTGKMHGYRVTILGGDKRFTVKCESTEKDWPLLKNAFIRTLNSIAPGGA